ncbi:hypothetical protein E2C01_027185 [Portunus trituberculatus]|uniref:Uncharacterized protein n=1 Tax=Portunus trituberculatus TaxID=210409 RepID=A0A5B7EH93_PORTR|nr:hypothetical protein [Portunus trituberculatus]
MRELGATSTKNLTCMTGGCLELWLALVVVMVEEHVDEESHPPLLSSMAIALEVKFWPASSREVSSCAPGAPVGCAYICGQEDNA